MGGVDEVILLAFIRTDAYQGSMIPWIPWIGGKKIGLLKKEVATGQACWCCPVIEPR